MRSFILMNYSRFLIIPMVLGLIACHSKPEKTTSIQLTSNGEIHVSIDPKNLPPLSKLSDIVESIRIIPLETNISCFIKTALVIYVGRNSVLIITSNGPFYRFSTDGKFLNNIGAIGKGPGEYISLYGMTASEESSRVNVRSWQMRKILEYSFDGKPIREIPFANGVNTGAILDSNRILFTSNVDYEVRIINALNGDTLKYFKTSPQPGLWMPFLSGNPSMGFYYSALGRDTVWKIDADSLRPKIICDFGSGHLSSIDFYKSITNPNGFPSGKLSLNGSATYGSGYFALNLLREVGRGAYEYVNVLINEKALNSWHLGYSKLNDSDDILFSRSGDFKTVSASGEWVSLIMAEDLVTALPEIKENKNFKYPPELIAQLEKIVIEDNPILVLYKLK